MAMPSFLKSILYFVILLFLLPLIPLATQSLKKIYQRNFDERIAVGVLPIKGTLSDASDHIKQLTTYFKDIDIKAILIKMDCPGGASGTSQAIFGELVALKKEHQKPVVVWVENMCASGAYYIALGADHIVASPSAIIGSIGVYAPFLFQLKDFLEQHKIKYAPVQSGAYKSATNPLVDRTPEQTAMLQALLDDTYDQFINDVAQYRKLPLQTAQEWANGKIFTGRQAQKLGLIDTLGTPNDVATIIKQKAGIEKEIRWIHLPAKGGLLSSLTGDQKENDDQSLLSAQIHEICTILETRYGSPVLR